MHVNDDAAVASIVAIQLALAYRNRFGEDVLVDLVGYRRYGHNEQDETAYTQPLMAERIARQPTVRELLARNLREEGVVTDAQVDTLDKKVETELKAAHERLKSSFGKSEIEAAY